MADEKQSSIEIVAELVAGTVSTPAPVVEETVSTEDIDLDAIAAEAASSYSPAFSSFEIALRELFSLSVTAAGGEDSTVKWLSHICKLRTMLDKTMKPEAFKPMFSKFASEHAEELTKPLFNSESDSIEDGFFKRLEKQPMVGGKASLRVNCEGPVVFFNKERADLAAINFPIGELYRAAINVHIEAKPEDVKKKVLPTLVLLQFYLVLYFATNGDETSVLSNNVLDLCDAAEVSAPGSGPGCSSTKENSVVPPADLDMLTGFLDKAGITSMLGSQGGNLHSTVRGFGSIFNKLVEQVSSGAGGALGSDPSDIMNRLGAAFQSKEIQEDLVKATQSASGLMSSVSPKPTLQEGPPTD
jgi:hypothetical protein